MDENTITLRLPETFDTALLPIPAPQNPKRWWADNDKTRNHAQHCLPLLMANSLGYYILSPAAFTVEWNGDVHANAEISISEASSHCDIDNHAAYGSFAVQPGFIPTTRNPGDFIFIKGIPNERASPYTCMEALIEAWWSPASFGLVFLLNQPGRFSIKMGDPIAQMFLFKAEGGFARLKTERGLPDEYPGWEQKRRRTEYVRDLDYMHGKHPDGRPEPTHIPSWRIGILGTSL